jgi:hypothetical protein
VSGSSYDERPFLRVYESATGRFWRKAVGRSTTFPSVRAGDWKAVAMAKPIKPFSETTVGFLGPGSYRLFRGQSSASIRSSVCCREASIRRPLSQVDIGV